tara:strand:+ start:2004 stop:2159 length:156 start_codon:yes stop_codon:yes gene_type:complete
MRFDMVLFGSAPADSAGTTTGVILQDPVKAKERFLAAMPFFSLDGKRRYAD